MNFLRKHFSYANIVATMALVFAMGGTAIAAKHYIITSTHQIKPSVLKKLKGDKGASGPRGLAGVTGPTGPPGLRAKKGSLDCPRSPRCRQVSRRAVTTGSARRAEKAAKSSNRR